MKTVKKLINANSDTRLGNHRVEHVGQGRKFVYHWTAIVIVNDANKTFQTDNGGWGTQSTTRAINAYRRELTGMGYKEVTA